MEIVALWVAARLEMFDKSQKNWEPAVPRSTCLRRKNHPGLGKLLYEYRELFQKQSGMPNMRKSVSGCAE